MKRYSSIRRGLTIEQLNQLARLEGGVVVHADTGVPVKHTRQHRLGYREVRLGGHRILLHRLVVALRDQRWPRLVHHIDGNPTDNDPANLLAVDDRHNSRAQGHARNSPTGRPGIKITPGGKYEAGLHVKPRRTKVFDDWHDADKFVTAQETALGWPPRPWRRVTFKQALRRRQPLPQTLDWHARRERDDE